MPRRSVAKAPDSASAQEDPSQQPGSTGPAGQDRAGGDYDDEAFRHEIMDRLDTISEGVRKRLAADLTGLDEFLRSTRRLLVTNFLVGLARGTGFLLGATLVGGMVVWVAALAFNKSMEAFKQDVNADTIIQQVAELRNKLMSAFSETPQSPLSQPVPRSGARPTPRRIHPPHLTPVPTPVPIPTPMPVPVPVPIPAPIPVPIHDNSSRAP